MDVERGLPPRVETKVMCHCSEMQAFWYKRLLLKDADIMSRVSGGQEQEQQQQQQQPPGAGALVNGARKKLTGEEYKRLQSLIVQLVRCWCLQIDLARPHDMIFITNTRTYYVGSGRP